MKEQQRHAPEHSADDKESAVERCDCLVLDPCGCFVDPCVCVRTDERGCYTDCGCPDRSSAVLRTPLI